MCSSRRRQSTPPPCNIPTIPSLKASGTWRGCTWLGWRIFYTQHGGYDTHASEVPTHPRLVGELSAALKAFMQDLEEHHAADEVVILVFTEFGRRIKDNGSGTDHGSGGGAFIIGTRVA